MKINIFAAFIFTLIFSGSLNADIVTAEGDGLETAQIAASFPQHQSSIKSQETIKTAMPLKILDLLPSQKECLTRCLAEIHPGVSAIEQRNGCHIRCVSFQ